MGREKELSCIDGNAMDILDALSNPSWPRAEVALGHGIWWNDDRRLPKLQQAILAVLYATVPLSYSDLYPIIYDAQVLADCISSVPTRDAVELGISSMKSVRDQLRYQISSLALAQRRHGRYVYETVGLGRRALLVTGFTDLFVAVNLKVTCEGESETQLPVPTALPETYAGYSLKALGAFEYNLLKKVTGEREAAYLESEVWCLTRPNAINLAVGCNIEAERVQLPPQLPSWNSANAMYPCSGVYVAGEAGVIAYHSERRIINSRQQNANFFKPEEKLYVENYRETPVASVHFGKGVTSGMLYKIYENNIYDTQVLSSAGSSVVVKDVALMWQKVYQSEVLLGNGGCIARRVGDPTKCEPLMIPLPVISKEVLPHIFCVEILSVANEIVNARKVDYRFDLSSWPFLFCSPHNLLMMLVAVASKTRLLQIHSDDEGDSCTLIIESMKTNAGVRGKAKAILECLATLYRYVAKKVEKKIRNGVGWVAEYFGDTALWAVLNALSSLELAYTKKGQSLFRNSVIISNVARKASSCVALLENLKRDLDDDILDKGIEKFLAHAAVVLASLKSPVVHLFRDRSLGILASNYILSTVDNTQVNLRWANKDRNSGLATLSNKPVDSPYRYRAILKTGEVGVWSDYVGKKLVDEIEVGLWNVETMSLLYNDAVRVICLAETVDLSLVGRKAEEISRERFVLWKHKQELVKQALQIVEEVEGVLLDEASGPTEGIWKALLEWQQSKESSGIGKDVVREVAANAIVLGAVATGCLVETPVLTEHISIIRKYLSGETFLLWNGNAHYEVKDIPQEINVPIEMVIHCGEDIGIRMAKSEFAKLLVKSVNGSVVSQVIDTADADDSAQNLSEHFCNYAIRPSRLRQYTLHQGSKVVETMLTAASKHLTKYRMNDQRLIVMVDEIRNYEEENALKVLSDVDEHGNLRLRISGKSTSITTTSTQGSLTVNAASVVSASGNRLSQHQEQTETNVDQEVVVTSLISLRMLLRNRAKSRETKKGLGAVASAIIAQNIAANRKVRYRAGQNGCWGIVRRLTDGGEDFEDEAAVTGALVLIDGPLAVRKGTAFQLSTHHESGLPVLKILIDRGQLIVLCGLTLVENGDHANVVRLHLPSDGKAWFESYSSGMNTGDRFSGLPCSIEVGMVSDGFAHSEKDQA